MQYLDPTGPKSFQNRGSNDMGKLSSDTVTFKRHSGNTYRRVLSALMSVSNGRRVIFVTNTGQHLRIATEMAQMLIEPLLFKSSPIKKKSTEEVEISFEEFGKGKVVFVTPNYFEMHRDDGQHFDQKIYDSVSPRSV